MRTMYEVYVVRDIYIYIGVGDQSTLKGELVH